MSVADFGVIAVSIALLIAIAIASLSSFDLEAHMRGENIIHGVPAEDKDGLGADPEDSEVGESDSSQESAN